MAGQGGQLVRECVHEIGSRDLTCHAPSAEDLEAVYWIKNKQWHMRDSEGKFSFKPEAPQRVLDSYELWAKDNVHR